MEKARFVQHLFDGLAPSYDQLNQLISFGMHWRWKRLACQALHVQNGATVLDVCTGTGDNVRILRQLTSMTGRITGLDFSSNMLALAKQRYAGDSDIHFIQGDAHALPFEDHSFDGAIISFGLRNVIDSQQVIMEMTRVSKPGSWVVSLDTSPNPNLPGYWLYFQKLMPLMGRLLAGNQAAYDYLANSTKQFAPPETVANMFMMAGLLDVRIQPLAFNSVAIISGRKAA